MTGLCPVYLGTVIRVKEADTRVFFVSRRLVKRERWLVKSNNDISRIYTDASSYIFMSHETFFKDQRKKYDFKKISPVVSPRCI